MPLLKLETTAAIPEDKRKGLMASLSKILAGTTGKPEEYVMVTASQAAIVMAGRPGDAAFVDIRSIGALNADVNKMLSQQVCRLITNSVGISSDRIYVNFTDVSAENWGWNGSTFGSP